MVDSRERLAAAEHGLVEIERLGSIIAQRDETVADLRKDLSQRVVMDALVAAANILAEREPRFAVIERKGLAKLRAVVEPGVEVAVVLVHGLDSKWSVMSGSRLEMQGVRGETVQSLDLKAMRETVRNTHAFASATSVRLRVVLESGDLAGGRTDFVFTRVRRLWPTRPNFWTRATSTACEECLMFLYWFAAACLALILAYGCLGTLSGTLRVKIPVRVRRTFYVR